MALKDGNGFDESLSSNSKRANFPLRYRGIEVSASIRVALNFRKHLV